MPDAISQALAGKTITSVGSVFDDYFGHVDSLVLIIRTEAATYLDINPWKLVLLTLAVAIYGLAGLSAAIGFAITVFAKVALAVVIALGPIFIALSLFATTRRFFYGCLGQVFNYIALMSVRSPTNALNPHFGAPAL